MPTRRTQSTCPTTSLLQTEVRARDDRWRLCVASVGGGVVTGRRRRGNGNAHSDAWSLFQTREQYDACAASDPLRFEDPLMFARMNQEIHHAFDQQRQTDAR